MLILHSLRIVSSVTITISIYIFRKSKGCLSSKYENKLMELNSNSHSMSSEGQLSDYDDENEMEESTVMYVLTHFVLKFEFILCQCQTI